MIKSTFSFPIYEVTEPWLSLRYATPLRYKRVITKESEEFVEITFEYDYLLDKKKYEALLEDELKRYLVND